MDVYYIYFITPQILTSVIMITMEDVDRYVVTYPVHTDVNVKITISVILDLYSTNSPTSVTVSNVFPFS